MLKLEPADETRRDELLRQIDEKDHLPTSMYGRMMESVAYLSNVGGENALMVVCGFLTDVLQRGAAVFTIVPKQVSMLDDPDPKFDGRVTCPFNHDVGATLHRSYGRDFLHAKCPTHGLDLVHWIVDEQTTPV